MSDDAGVFVTFFTSVLVMTYLFLYGKKSLFSVAKNCPTTTV